MAKNDLRTVIYPGTFDPITNGHLDVIVRALILFDKVVVAIAENPDKTPLFTVEERLDMIRVAVKGLGKVEVDHFSGLVVSYATTKGACAIIRGLRAISDFEAEFQMALMNRHMDRDVATVFLMPHDRYTHLNSTIIREIASLDGDVSDFVPPIVVEYLNRKYSDE
ncbi:MAG: pantetheine-phosphate adenylyltransferase [Fidelibacterota bacterium]|nr:MAG: pantetheine-phosphate adenylyltransferase [Candidatus Neomarinimicrobiota bacterium]